MIIGEYLTFLIGGDWVFSPYTDSLGCQRFKGASWALVLGLPLRDTIKSLLHVSWDTKASSVSPGLPFPWASVGGPSRLFPNLISCPPAFAYGGRAQGLYHFLNRVLLALVCSGMVWLGLSRRHMSCDNDDLLVFAPIFSSSFRFF